VAHTLTGLFPSRLEAEQAVVQLQNAGFDPSTIGTVMPDKSESGKVVYTHGNQSGEGAVAGGIVGGTAGALMAATGAIFIPGVGPFIAGGILATLIGGAAGWLVGGLVGLGIPKEEAEYYENQVQSGRALVTVDAEGREAEAHDILIRNGAEDLSARGYGGYTMQTSQPGRFGS
jgi:hypothetical protein